MKVIRGGAAAVTLLSTFAFAASAQGAVTSSSITAPVDGSLLFNNLDTSPTATVTVSGMTNGTTGDSVDIDCYNGGSAFPRYAGGAFSGVGPGVPVNANGSFSATIPYSFFLSGVCDLVAVPHGTSASTLPSGDIGARVTFSGFRTFTSGGKPYDFALDDATTQAGTSVYSIDDGGPTTYLVDGTGAMNKGSSLFYYGGSFYNSAADFGGTTDLTRADIQVDGQNAYGSASAYELFHSTALPGFPVLTSTLDSFDGSTHNAQTTESEGLVRCTPNDVFNPSSADCTAFASTGVMITRVTDFTNSGRVATVTDTFTSTDGQPHSLDLRYEMDLGSPDSGWMLPGQQTFTAPGTGTVGPAAPTGPGTAYAIYDDSGTPQSVTNPVGALTFAKPYNAVIFDNTLWSGQASALFDYQETVPAGGSTSIVLSYATGASLSEVQGYAASAQDAMQAPAVSISSPASGTTETSSPVTVSGSASAGSGVKSVTVNGVSAAVSGGTWTAAVPLAHGQNTLNATVTSNGGKTATATATIAYAPPPQVSLAAKRAGSSGAIVELACSAAGSDCAGSVTLRTTQTVVKHHKRHRISVVVGRTAYTIAWGQTGTVQVALNATGRKLLRTQRRLLVKGNVALTKAPGQTVSAANFSLTFKQHRKHR